MEKEKRFSAGELLSHSFNKTFCEVQKPNCILSVSLKRWKEQGAEGCNFHVYTQILRKNLPLPNTFIQHLEVQTQIKQRLWSPQLRRSPSRTRSSELKRRKKGAYDTGEQVQVQGGESRTDAYFNPLELCLYQSWIYRRNLACNARKIPVLALQHFQKHTYQGWNVRVNTAGRETLTRRDSAHHSQSWYAQKEMRLQP